MMDVFSMFSDAPSRAAASKPSLKRRGGDLVARKGLVVRVTSSSVLFYDDVSVQEVFVPLSQVRDFYFTSSGGKRGLTLQDLELDDEVTLVIPKWLAKKEGMV